MRAAQPAALLLVLLLVVVAHAAAGAAQQLSGGAWYANTSLLTETFDVEAAAVLAPSSTVYVATRGAPARLLSYSFLSTDVSARAALSVANVSVLRVPESGGFVYAVGVARDGSAATTVVRVCAANLTECGSVALDAGVAGSAPCAELVGATLYVCAPPGAPAALYAVDTALLAVRAVPLPGALGTLRALIYRFSSGSLYFAGASAEATPRAFVGAAWAGNGTQREVLLLPSAVRSVRALVGYNGVAALPGGGSVQVHWLLASGTALDSAAGSVLPAIFSIEHATDGSRLRLLATKSVPFPQTTPASARAALFFGFSVPAVGSPASTVFFGNDACIYSFNPAIFPNVSAPADCRSDPMALRTGIVAVYVHLGSLNYVPLLVGANSSMSAVVRYAGWNATSTVQLRVLDGPQRVISGFVKDNLTYLVSQSTEKYASNVLWRTGAELPSAQNAPFALALSTSSVGDATVFSFAHPTQAFALVASSRAPASLFKLRLVPRSTILETFFLTPSDGAVLGASLAPDGARLALLTSAGTVLIVSVGSLTLGVSRDSVVSLPSSVSSGSPATIVLGSTHMMVAAAAPGSAAPRLAFFSALFPYAEIAASGSLLALPAPGAATTSLRAALHSSSGGSRFVLAYTASTRLVVVLVDATMQAVVRNVSIELGVAAQLSRLHVPTSSSEHVVAAFSVAQSGDAGIALVNIERERVARLFLASPLVQLRRIAAITEAQNGSLLQLCDNATVSSVATLAAPRPSEAARSSAARLPAGLLVGDRVVVNVTARNGGGAPQYFGGDNVTHELVCLSGCAAPYASVASPASYALTDYYNGTYGGALVLLREGTYLSRVFLNGQEMGTPIITSATLRASYSLVLALPTLLQTSEAGQALSIACRLSRPAEGRTVLAVRIEPPGAATVSPATLVFASDDWFEPRTLTVRGRRNDAAASNVSFALVFAAAASDDPSYNGLVVPPLVNLTNRKIPVWPVVTEVFPPLLARDSGATSRSAGGAGAGATLTIVGRNFAAPVSVLVNDVSVGAAALAYVSSSRVVADLSLLDVRGYLTVQLVNPDGGYDFAPEGAAYLTTDCALEGFYGPAGACRACPASAVCPGGWRLWPRAGFWSAGENDTNLVQCFPTQRCLGGRSSACLADSEGFACSECSAGFTAVGKNCLACPPPVVLYAVLAAFVVFVALLALALACLPSGGRARVVFCLASTQFALAPSLYLSPLLPMAVRETFAAAGFVLLDTSALRLQCLVAALLPNSSSGSGGGGDASPFVVYWSASLLACALLAVLHLLWLALPCVRAVRMRAGASGSESSSSGGSSGDTTVAAGGAELDGSRGVRKGSALGESPRSGDVSLLDASTLSQRQWRQAGGGHARGLEKRSALRVVVPGRPAVGAGLALMRSHVALMEGSDPAGGGASRSDSSSGCCCCGSAGVASALAAAAFLALTVSVFYAVGGLVCVPTPAGALHLEAALSMRCLEGSQLALLVLGGLVLVLLLIVLPAVLTRLLLRHRLGLFVGSAPFRAHYGFLYEHVVARHAARAPLCSLLLLALLPLAGVALARWPVGVFSAQAVVQCAALVLVVALRPFASHYYTALALSGVLASLVVTLGNYVIEALPMAPPLEPESLIAWAIGASMVGALAVHVTLGVVLTLASGASAHAASRPRKDAPQPSAMSACCRCTRGAPSSPTSGRASPRANAGPSAAVAVAIAASAAHKSPATVPRSPAHAAQRRVSASDESAPTSPPRSAHGNASLDLGSARDTPRSARSARAFGVASEPPSQRAGAQWAPPTGAAPSAHARESPSRPRQRDTAGSESGGRHDLSARRGSRDSADARSAEPVRAEASILSRQSTDDSVLRPALPEALQLAPITARALETSPSSSSSSTSSSFTEGFDVPEIDPVPSPLSQSPRRHDHDDLELPADTGRRRRSAGAAASASPAAVPRGHAGSGDVDLQLPAGAGGDDDVRRRSFGADFDVTRATEDVQIELSLAVDDDVRRLSTGTALLSSGGAALLPPPRSRASSDGSNSGGDGSHCSAHSDAGLLGPRSGAQRSAHRRR